MIYSFLNHLFLGLKLIYSFLIYIRDTYFNRCLIIFLIIIWGKICFMIYLLKFEFKMIK